MPHPVRRPTRPCIACAPDVSRSHRTCHSIGHGAHHPCPRLNGLRSLTTSDTCLPHRPRPPLFCFQRTDPPGRQRRRRPSRSPTPEPTKIRGIHCTSRTCGTTNSQRRLKGCPGATSTQPRTCSSTPQDGWPCGGTFCGHRTVPLHGPARRTSPTTGHGSASHCFHRRRRRMVSQHPSQCRCSGSSASVHASQCGLLPRPVPPALQHTTRTTRLSRRRRRSPISRRPQDPHRAHRKCLRRHTRQPRGVTGQ